MENFHITLPSNVKSDYGNTSSSYRTTLPYKLDLTGDWEVGVSEVFLPVSHYNIGNGNDRDRQIYFRIPDLVLVGVTISAGNYSTIGDLIKEINRELQTVLKPPYSCKFHLDDITRHTLIVMSKKPGFSLAHLGTELSYVLGFPLSLRDVDFRQDGRVVSSYPCDISANLNQVYIYSDLIKTQIVGNTEAKLLRIVSINEGVFGQVIHKNFDRPQYHALACNTLSDIQIELRTGGGKIFPIKFGTTIVQLTFRRRGLRL